MRRLAGDKRGQIPLIGGGGGGGLGGTVGVIVLGILGILALIAVIIIILYPKLFIAVLFLSAGMFVVYVSYKLAKEGIFNQKAAQVGIAVGLIVMLGGAGFSVVFFTIGPGGVSVDTVSVGEHLYGIRFRGNQVDLRDGSNLQLLDATEYITARKSGDLSDKVVVEGEWKRDFPSLTTFQENEYRVFVNTGSGWNQKFTSPPLAQMGGGLPYGTWFPGDAWTFEFTEVLDGGVRVEWWGRVTDPQCGGLFDDNCGWLLLVRDEAYLTSATGGVELTVDRYFVSDSVSVSVDIGSATRKDGSPIFSVDIYSATQGQTVVFSMPVTQSGKNTYTTGYIVQAADFTSDPALCVGKNMIIAYLFNDLSAKDKDDAPTSETPLAADLPPKPTLNVNNAGAKVGETITVTVDVPDGHTAMAYDILVSGATGLEFSTPEGYDSPTASWTAQKVGDFWAEGRYQEMCEWSDADQKLIRIIPVDQDFSIFDNPEIPIFGIMLLIVGLILVAVGVMVYMAYKERTNATLVAAVMSIAGVIILIYGAMSIAGVV